jgi:hypothetical protein
MRQGPPPNGRRPRGRHHGGGHGGNGGHGGGHGGSGGNTAIRGGGGGDNRPRSAASLRHQSFDSNCIDLRVRGNAWQVHEKYQALARDAQASGDRVAAENYLQHAEHYFRIIEAINEATAVEQRQSGRPPGAAPFGGQPEMPANYYGAEGVPPVTVPGEASGNVAPLSQQQMPQQQAQAEVQVRQPPQNPFFSPEEAESAGDGPQSLIARR